MLYNTMLQLHTTDFTKPEATQAIKSAEKMVALLEYQTAIEESVLFPSIHDYEPLVTTILADDHRERRKHICKLKQFISSNKNISEEYLSILFAGRLINRFNDFMMLCLQQMRNHETMITPVLWRYYSDEELQLISSSLQEVQTVNKRKMATAA